MNRASAGRGVRTRVELWHADARAEVAQREALGDLDRLDALLPHRGELAGVRRGVVRLEASGRERLERREDVPVRQALLFGEVRAHLRWFELQVRPDFHLTI